LRSSDLHQTHLFSIMPRGAAKSYGTNATKSREHAGTYLGTEGALHPDWIERSAPYALEFVGVFVLTAVYLCSSGLHSVWAASANALMLLALMTAFGHVCGGNFNPSVSIALYLSGRQSLGVTARFCIAQFAGAALAATLAYLGASEVINVHMGPNDGFGPWALFVVEVQYTAMLCLAYLSCAASPQNNPTRDQNCHAAIAVAFSFIGGAYASRTVSGSVLNPAIAFGVGIVQTNTWATFYFLCEIVGALIAAGTYRLLRPKDLSDLGSSALPASHADVSPIAAEFVGTFYVVLTKAMMHAAEHINEPWAVASAHVAMVYSMRDLSGAYFNPAVTLSIYMSGHFPEGVRVTAYICAQVLGGLVGATFFGTIHTNLQLPVRPSNSMGNRGSIVIVETLFTCFLCYVVLSTSLANPTTAPGSKHNNVAGLAVAGAYLVSGLSVGTISGAVLNPAIAIGYSGLAGLVGDGSSVCLPYIIYECLGALMASFFCSVTHGRLIVAGDLALEQPRHIEDKSEHSDEC